MIKRDIKKTIALDTEPGSEFWDKIYAGRIPLLGMFELTRRCNLNCPYCYVAFDHGISPEEELSAEQIFSLIDQVAEAGCLFLTFTGGEPLLRKDFSEIYIYTLNKGIFPVVFTGGTLIDEKMAAFFQENPPYFVDITLHGVTAGTYERVSRVEGSFKKAMRAIKLLQEYEVALRLKSVISTLNRDEVGEIRKFVRDLGILYRFDTLLTPQLNGSLASLSYRLSPEEIVELDLEDEERWEDFLDFACRYRGRTDSDLLYKCGGGLHSFCISSTGKLGLCVLDTNYRYDLLTGSFKEGWESFIPSVRERKITSRNECSDCGIFAICANCPAWSKLETGGPENLVEFRCQVAHLRVKLLDKEIKRREVVEVPSPKISA